MGIGSENLKGTLIQENYIFDFGWKFRPFVPGWSKNHTQSPSHKKKHSVHCQCSSGNPKWWKNRCGGYTGFGPEFGVHPCIQNAQLNYSKCGDHENLRKTIPVTPHKSELNNLFFGVIGMTISGPQTSVPCQCCSRNPAWSMRAAHIHRCEATLSKKCI